MTKFHINDRGEPAPCNAQPGNCPKGEDQLHFDSQDKAQEYIENSQKDKVLLAVSKKNKKNSITSLNKISETPAWFNAIEKEHKDLGSDFELLGQFTQNGEQFAIGKTNRSIELVDLSMPTDSGFNITRYTLHDSNGNEIGKLKLAEMTDESLKEAYGEDEYRGFRYMDRYSGRQYGLKNYESDEIEFHGTPSPDEKKDFDRALWLNVAKNDELGRYSDKPGYQLTEEDIPDDDKQISKDISKAHKKALTKMKNMQNFNLYPSVDYSKLEENQKGKGLGAKLYHVAAKDLAKQNKFIRGSGVQSDEAQHLWESFKEKDPSKISTIKLPNPRATDEYTEYYILDYRNSKD